MNLRQRIGLILTITALTAGKELGWTALFIFMLGISLFIIPEKSKTN